MPGLPAIWQAGLGQGVMDNGKSGSLDKKTQFMAMYSIIYTISSAMFEVMALSNA